jgi:hypothetical protein
MVSDPAKELRELFNELVGWRKDERERSAFQLALAQRLTVKSNFSSSFS